GADRCAATLADAVRAGLDALERRVDLSECLASALLEAFVELTVVHRCRRVAQVVVRPALSELAELLGDASRVLLLEEVDRMQQPRLLFIQPLAVLRRVDRAHLGSSPAPLASASRRSISAGRMPSSATVLSREERPETICTSRVDNARVSASRRIT